MKELKNKSLKLRNKIKFLMIKNILIGFNHMKYNN